MNIKTPYILSGAILLLLVGGAAWQYSRSTSAPLGDTGTTTVITVDPNATSTTAGGYTVEREVAVQTPDYNKPLPYSKSVSAEVRIAAETQLADIRTKLDANSTDYNTWMRLATLHKIIGNPQGAIDIWLFGTKLWSTDPIVHRNLGEIYASQGKTKDSRAMYQKAIDLALEQGDAKLLTQLRAESGIK